ncbi:MAG: ATP-binding cassette domain-containing protein, partial [Nitrospiraceae bacterium]|nr:ATP-binding cassette domain-containing protein [Nitrospiraceae bacterium]
MGLILSISDIYKSYNGISVLKDCSFSFDDSGIYVLTGANGSGKSTFLRICALVENPDKGEIDYLSGNNIVTKDMELRRRITLVLPKIGIFNTTVFKNAAYGLKIRGIKGKEMEERVNKALDFVGLMHKKNQ